MKKMHPNLMTGKSVESTSMCRKALINGFLEQKHISPQRPTINRLVELDTIYIWKHRSLQRCYKENATELSDRRRLDLSEVSAKV